jgi:glutathione S-transferase
LSPVPNNRLRAALGRPAIPLYIGTVSQNHPTLPVLYSFRRCPYAIRARMALRYSGIPVQLREVVLRDKPQALLQCSPKGTVPVLVLPHGTVIEESRDIMAWALARHDPDDWLLAHDPGLLDTANALMDANDFSFKAHLDHYKYAERYPGHSQVHYRAQGEVFLRELDTRLTRHSYLLGAHLSLADVAIFPFVRQFALVDKAWFDASSYTHLQQWLENFLDSALFKGVMAKHAPWQPGSEAIVFP